MILTSVGWLGNHGPSLRLPEGLVQIWRHPNAGHSGARYVFTMEKVGQLVCVKVLF